MVGLSEWGAGYKRSRIFWSRKEKHRRFWAGCLIILSLLHFVAYVFDIVEKYYVYSVVQTAKRAGPSEVKAFYANTSKSSSGSDDLTAYYCRLTSCCYREKKRGTFTEIKPSRLHSIDIDTNVQIEKVIRKKKYLQNSSWEEWLAQLPINTGMVAKRRRVFVSRTAPTGTRMH